MPAPPAAYSSSRPLLFSVPLFFFAAYSSSRMTSSSLGLCFALRPVGGLSGKTREGFGWPTRSRALAFTAFAAENRAGLRFAIASMSME
jgi:hypothetical protein